MTPKDSLQNPWAGLASYEDPAISKRQLLFCGRDAESYDVARLIDNNFVITLYGRSGIGKTSLIQAGVFPLLRREQYTPLVVRFGIRSDVTRSFQDLLTDAIENSLRKSGGTIRVVNVVDEQTDRQAPDYLWNYFARRQFIHADGGVTFPVAVFDQFEEVFRKPDDRQQAETLLAQLRYLADETHALPDRIVDGQPYSYDFNFRFVLVIREDDLYRLEDSIDNCSLATLKQFRYRLRPLSDECTRSVITIPGAGLFVEAEQKHIVRTIKEIARNKEDDSVSTNILSLICNRIFEAYRKSSSEYITSELVETFVKGNPFEQFYKDATKELAKDERYYLERNLVDSSGHRDSVSESDFEKAIKKGERRKELIEGEMRILQRSAVSSSEGNARIELLHDSFCEPILKQRDKRKRRERVMWITTLYGVTMFFVSVIWYVWNQNWQMKENQARFVAEKVQPLADEGDSYLIIRLVLEVLPEDLSALILEKPYVPEVEEALRKAWDKNSGIMKLQDGAFLFANFSSGGDSIVSASANGVIYVWNPENGECVDTLEGHSSSIYSVSFSCDGKKIVSASDDKTVRIWDAKTGFCVDTLVHSKYVQFASFSTDGSRIVSASGDKTVRIWNASTGVCLDTLTGHTSEVNSASFSPDGSRIVSAASDNTIRIWDASTGVCLDTLTGHTSVVNSAFFSPDGRQIVSASNDGTVRIWSTTGVCLDTLTGQWGTAQYASFSSNNKRIVFVSGDDVVRVWNASTGVCLDTLTGHTKSVYSVCFSPDGNKIVSASLDGSLRIWDISEEKDLKKFDYTSWIYSASFDTDGSRIVSASSDSTVRIWDASTGICLDTLIGHTGDVYSASFSPDGSRIVSASSDSTVRIWNAATGECIRTLYGYGNYLRSATFSPDRKNIVLAHYDKFVKLWNAETGECIRTLTGHTDDVYSAAFSPQGDSIVSASRDGTVKLWNARTGECIRTITEHKYDVNSATFSPDGKIIVSASDDKTVHVWDFKKNEEFLIEGHKNSVRSVAFSPDGEKIVSASDDGTVRVWDFKKRTLIKVFDGIEGGHISVVFSPDGNKIVSTGSTIRVWDFPPLQTLMDKARERFKNCPLTKEERRKYYLN